jgi:Fe-S-cluster-containing hydrogenase component 2
VKILGELSNLNFPVKCRHCRLQKCIQIGMKQELVNVNVVIFDKSN